MSSLPSDISSLLIPMQGRPWLIPNIVVAEIIPCANRTDPVMALNGCWAG